MSLSVAEKEVFVMYLVTFSYRRTLTHISMQNNKLFMLITMQKLHLILFAFILKVYCSRNKTQWNTAGDIYCIKHKWYIASTALTPSSLILSHTHAHTHIHTHTLSLSPSPNCKKTITSTLVKHVVHSVIFCFAFWTLFSISLTSR